VAKHPVSGSPDSHTGSVTEFRMVPIDAVPAYKRVADAIEQQILQKHLALGDILATEHQLAEQLNVHRSTVREGIRALEHAGLLRRVSGKRLMICAPNSRDIAWTTTRALGMNRVSFVEIWEVQMQIDPFAAGLAAQRGPDDLKRAIKNNVDETRKRLSDDTSIIELDVAFHRLVAEATLNRALITASRPISNLLFAATKELYQRLPQARDRLLFSHQQISDSIWAGNTARARDWMAKHMRDFRVGYQLANFDPHAPIDFDPLASRI
jgi:GntR family transcriptional regulator, transcriptional repressor for pyruvate dehydrogenase complex